MEISGGSKATAVPCAAISMQTGPVSFTSMRRRIVLVVTIAILMALIAASWIAVLVIVTDRDADLADRVSGLAPAFARQLESRLQMANALVQYLSSTDAGSDDSSLRQRVQASDAFGGVFFVSWASSIAEVD